MATWTGTTGTLKTTELTITTRNELGTLARITTVLAKQNINIDCYNSYEWGNEAAFRLITNNNRKALDLLKNEGFNVQENQVVLWTTPNTPGRLSTATTALAESRVNINSSYSSTLTNSTTTVVVMSTTDTDRTLDILNRVS